jgi:hypothetical protein
MIQRFSSMPPSNVSLTDLQAGMGGADEHLRNCLAFCTCSLISACSFRGRKERKLIYQTSSGSKFISGDAKKMKRIFSKAGGKRFEYRLCVVQPGISVAKLNENIAGVLAAVSDYVLTATGLLYQRERSATS